MLDLENAGRNKEVNRLEKQKNFPDRFPNNTDSIGIEIVGMAKGVYMDNNKKVDVYEVVNELQNNSLKWLLYELTDTLKVPMSEIYRHPDIGRKNPTEASTAKW